MRLGLLRRLLTVLLTSLLAAQAHAQSEDDSLWNAALDGFNPHARPTDQWRLMLSPYTYHFNPSPEHKHVWLVGVERERERGSLAGFAYFSNSFGQGSVYYYPWGWVIRDLAELKGTYVKWTAGLIYGYREPYENKVPLNYKGLSLAFVPGIGYEFPAGHQLQLNILGTAGFMVQFSARFK